MAILTTIFVLVEADGQSGAKLITWADHAPHTCPSADGWKPGEWRMWWTRMEGDDACHLLAAREGFRNLYMGLRVSKRGRIREIAQLHGRHITDDDLKEAHLDGTLKFRPWRP